MENWYVPITLLPSVGFFIVAITSVSNALSAEIARLIELDNPKNMDTISAKIKQLRLVSISLVLLYGSATILAFSGLIAGLQANVMLDMQAWVEVMVCLGISLSMVALLIMMLFAFRSVRIKEKQFQEM